MAFAKFLSRKSAKGMDPTEVNPGHPTVDSSENVSNVDLEKEEIPVAGSADRQSSNLADSPGKNQAPTALAEEEQAEKDSEADQMTYPTGFKLLVIVLALCLSVFLVALVSSFPWGDSDVECSSSTPRH